MYCYLLFNNFTNVLWSDYSATNVSKECQSVFEGQTTFIDFDRVYGIVWQNNLLVQRRECYISQLCVIFVIYVIFKIILFISHLKYIETIVSFTFEIFHIFFAMITELLFPIDQRSKADSIVHEIDVEIQRSTWLPFTETFTRNGMSRRRIRPSVFYCGDPRDREIIMEMNFDRYGGVEISTLPWHDPASTTMIPPSTIIFPTIFVPACKHPTVRYYEAWCNTHIYTWRRYNYAKYSFTFICSCKFARHHQKDDLKIREYPFK